MENKYIKHIIDEYLNNQYAEDTEDKICSWLIDEENVKEKNAALESHWNHLHVDPDIFLYDSLAQVKERIDELPQLISQIPDAEPIPTPVVEDVPKVPVASSVALPVIQLSSEEVVETPTFETAVEEENPISELAMAAAQEIATTVVDKPQEIIPQPVIQLKEESTGPAITRPSVSSWESEEVLTGMSFIEEEENNRSSVWWKIVAILIPFILILAGGYYYLNREPVAENWLTLAVPYGESNRLDLPDGSVVWLNAGSSLRYPEQFISGSRTVYLSGEGYFSVTKDAAKPFRVEAPDLTVEVLGTEFNLMAYPEEKKTITTLASGKIQIETSAKEKYILQPGQELTYDNHTAKAELRTVESLDDIRWKEGELIFKEKSLSDIIRVLERKYNLRFSVEDEFLQKEDIYTVKFVNQESIEDIMNVLKEIGSFSWTMESGSILISSHS